MVPTEPLWDVFTPAVIAKLQAAKSPSEHLRCRLAILGAGGLNPSLLNHELRAFKSAWETYNVSLSVWEASLPGWLRVMTAACGLTILR